MSAVIRNYWHDEQPRWPNTVHQHMLETCKLFATSENVPQDTWHLPGYLKESTHFQIASEPNDAWGHMTRHDDIWIKLFTYFWQRLWHCNEIKTVQTSVKERISRVISFLKKTTCCDRNTSSILWPASFYDVWI